MAKKGNRVQVILECTEHKIVECLGLQDIFLLRIKRTLLIVWS